MKFVLGWTLKLACLGLVYLGFTGGFHVKLPETVLGYKVPEAAQQYVDRTSKIAEYGQKTQAGFENIAKSLK
ncbi:MAG: hypothetical protein JSR47_11095 [Proteobacteria bacterium]|nr:hypothetical protein [Pseudomonadota bacterium]